ncbi:hypothetical protein [Glutamicibacter ardleyensis]|nr:hypothetical protein [Glutamicibacter ardleyensis]
METLVITLIVATIIWAVLAAAIIVFMAGCSRNWKAEKAAQEKQNNANHV